MKITHLFLFVIAIFLTLLFILPYNTSYPIYVTSNISNSTVSFNYNSTTAGLIGWWKFDDNSASQYDSSGNQKNGTVVGATYTLNSSFIGGSGFDFDGENDFINLTEFSAYPNETAGTLMAWINPDDVSGANMILFAGETGADGAGPETETELFINAKRMSFYIGSKSNNSNESQLVTPTIISNGHWYHVAASYNNTAGGLIRLYVNGKEYDNDTLSGTSETAWTHSYIGNTATGIRKFNGSIDDVKYYNTILTATQIKNIYQSRNPHFSTNETVTLNVTVLDNETADPEDLFYRWFVDGTELLSGYSEMLFAYNISVDQQTVSVWVNGSLNGIKEQEWDVLSDIDPPVVGLNLTFDNPYPPTTIVGAHNISGKFGMGQDFNGTSDYIKATNVSFSIKNLTLIAWVKPKNNIQLGHILYTSNVDFADGWGPYAEIHLSELVSSADGNWSGFSFYIEDENSNSVRLDGGSIDNLNTWYLVAATFQNGVNASLYVNGELVDSENSIATLNIEHWARNFWVGSSNNPAFRYYFNGSIDEVRVYNRLLSAREILNEYYSGINCTDADKDGFNFTIAPNCGPIDCADDDSSINPNTPKSMFNFTIDKGKGYYLIEANVSVTNNLTYICVKVDDGVIHKRWMPVSNGVETRFFERPYLNTTANHTISFYYNSTKATVSSVATTFQNFTDAKINGSFEAFFQYALNIPKQYADYPNQVVNTQYFSYWGFLPLLEFNDSRINASYKNQSLSFFEDSLMINTVSSSYGYMKGHPYATSFSDANGVRLVFTSFPLLYKFHYDDFTYDQLNMIKHVNEAVVRKCYSNEPTYENREYMSVWCNSEIGDAMMELETDPDKLEYWRNFSNTGYQQFDSFYKTIYNTTAARGVNEYLSSAYTYLQLYMLDGLYTYSRNQTVKDDAKKLLDYTYLTLLADWQNSSLKMTGPSSRFNDWYEDRGGIIANLQGKGFIPIEEEDGWYLTRTSINAYYGKYTFHPLFYSFANKWFPKLIKFSWGTNNTQFVMNYQTENFSVGTSGVAFQYPVDIAANTGENHNRYYQINMGGIYNPTSIIYVKMHNTTDYINSVSNYYPFIVTAQNKTDAMILQSSYYGRYQILNSTSNYTNWWTSIVFPVNISELYLNSRLISLENEITEDYVVNDSGALNPVVINVTLNDTIFFRQGNVIVGLKIITSGSVEGENNKIRIIRDYNDSMTTGTRKNYARVTIFNVNRTNYKTVNIGDVYSVIFTRTGLITNDTCDYCWNSSVAFRDNFRNLTYTYSNTSRSNISATMAGLTVSANVSKPENLIPYEDKTYLFKINDVEFGKPVFDSTLFSGIDCFDNTDCDLAKLETCENFKCVPPGGLGGPGGGGGGGGIINQTAVLFALVEGGGAINWFLVLVILILAILFTLLWWAESRRKR